MKSYRNVNEKNDVSNKDLSQIWYFNFNKIKLYNYWIKTNINK
jgi:hypothetical protein